MSTGQEIQMKLAQALPHLKAAGKALAETMTESAMLRLIGKEVCARRASKLRKRGELVRWSGMTCTGKSRYLWMHRLKLMPNVKVSSGAQEPDKSAAGSPSARP